MFGDIMDHIEYISKINPLFDDIRDKIEHISEDKPFVLVIIETLYITLAKSNIFLVVCTEASFTLLYLVHSVNL